MRHEPPRLLAAGDSALFVEFGDAIDREMHDRVRDLMTALEAAHLAGVVELVPTFRSLAIYYDPVVTSDEELRAGVSRWLSAAKTSGTVDDPVPVEVPVVYGGAWGPDLSTVAARACASESETVALFTGTIYRVYMLGFSPGFPYMGEVPPRLATPRLSTPRAKVPAGSVGIAGAQTGIYPMESPGGWQLIGRTPLAIYAPWREWPFRFRAGDRVRFTAIDAAEFERIYREEHPCASI